MSASTATPPVPPRPVRIHAAEAAGASHLPEIPPRPANKRLDRSVSPGNYPRSPLYEIPTSLSTYRPKTNEATLAPLARTPSVQNLPSIGQEGNEYADIQYQSHAPSSVLSADIAAQTRSVGEDLKLHAPKPSLPTASAKAQVQAVTRTDNSQAASYGYGRSPTPSQELDLDPMHQVRSRASFSSRPGSTASGERRSSVFADEQGPAELGMRVPINPLLGDVQAPSPAPFSTALTPTHTGGNERKRPGHHHRTKSGREVFLPPGSYGLHGHGVVPQDRFEQDWYTKHPEQLQNEEKFGHGVYESIGSGRGNFALSSDDLNKIVRNTANRGAGFGSNANTMSYPDEQIGYLASDQYSSRPQTASGQNHLTKMHSNTSQPAVESPLRKESFPADDSGHDLFNQASRGSMNDRSDHAVEDEEENIHISTPERHYNKVTGGEETIHETEEVRPYITHRSTEGGLVDEHGYSVPILAEDEVAKAVGGEFMQPAISPKQDRRGSLYDNEYRSSGDVTPSSRPASRPGSMYGIQGINHSLSRFSTHHDDHETLHTPLEDVAEYEPLFPDEDGNKRPVSHAERFKKRPDAHRFPSQDIWEETPSSSMHVATVSTPDLPSQSDESKQLGHDSASDLQKSETNAIRKGQPSQEEEKKLTPNEDGLARSRFAPHLRDEIPNRPGLTPRFPSQDIWEDSPDSQHLVTTVGGPQMAEETSVEEAKPLIPPRPAGRSRLGEGASSAQIAPSVPARPAKKFSVGPPDTQLNDLSIPAPKPASKETSPTERKAPTVPDRPKPQIPVRPAKKMSGDTLSKTLSATSARSIDTEKGVTSPPSVVSLPMIKAKPAIPARPGSKISNLKGNFMNDLNQKLGLGPPKDKDPEPEVEKEVKPLEDARKGRARGPQRRAPAKSPPSSAETAAVTTSVLGMFTPQSLWQISPGDSLLHVHPYSAPRLKAIPVVAPKEPSGINTKRDLSKERVEQMDHATVADARPPPTISTTEPQPEGTADVPIATALSVTKAGEFADPEAIAGPHAPMRELSDPMNRTIDESTDGGSLSQNTTESSGVTGHTLTREEPNPNTDAIPLSKHTTADTEGSGATLEKVETHPPVNRKTEEEAVELRDEQVSAPAPAVGVSEQDGRFGIAQQASRDERKADGIKEEASGAREPTEPMDEEDVSYKRLEEMTAKADGKGHAPEEAATKIMD